MKVAIREKISSFVDLMKNAKYWQIQGLNIVYVIKYFSLYVLVAGCGLFFVLLFENEMSIYFGEEVSVKLTELIINYLLICQSINLIMLGFGVYHFSFVKFLKAFLMTIILVVFSYLKEPFISNADLISTSSFIYSLCLCGIVYCCSDIIILVFWEKLRKQIRVEIEIGKEDFHYLEEPFTVEIPEQWVSFLEVQRFSINYWNYKMIGNLANYEMDIKLKYSLAGVTLPKKSYLLMNSQQMVYK